MTTLAEVQEKAGELTLEERESLLAHLIHSLPYAPLGPDDVEVGRREEEMNSGTVKGISHDELLRQVGRG